MAPKRRVLPELLRDILSPQRRLDFEKSEAAGDPGQPNCVKFPIGSVEGLEWALRELQWMDAMQKRQRALLDADVVQRTNTFLGRLIIRVTGKPVKFDDRRKALEAEAKKFCKQHRRKLLLGGAKSRELNHGTFGWRWRDAAVVAIKSPPKGVEAWFDKLVELIVGAMARLPGLFGKAARFASPRPVVNRTKLLEEYEAGRINDAELARMGFKYVPGGDVFFLKPSSQELQSTSSETPA